MSFRPTRRTPPLSAAAALLAASVALAGGGPENVLLVVNSASDDSKEIANHYVRLRDIPPSNVLYIDYRGDVHSIDGKGFREQILGPVLTALQVRGLALQIDTIAYSCDFPWRVLLRGDFPEGAKFPPVAKPATSLTAATYLWQSVLIKSPATLSLGANWYAGSLGPANQRQCSRLNFQQSRAFRSRYAWRSGGQRAPDGKGGRRYLMSTMLGVTAGRGNTVDEVVECLQRAAYADTSPPRGAFYYVKNSDIRSKTRHACYDQAAAALRGLGARAAVEEGVLPAGDALVAGMMLGSAKLPLAGARLKVEPGAICEHLTSSGGDFRETAFQTPLSDLIRAGAAGASGTIVEPLAIQAKFPAPSIHVHYRRGCSLAEAFYQSVAGPANLLVVGDPLCQPWAARPIIDVAGWPDPDSDEPRDEPLTITPRLTTLLGAEITPSFWELFVDGRLTMRAPSGTDYNLTPEELGPGWHSIRCVGIDPGPIEFQGRAASAVEFTRSAETDGDPSSGDRPGAGLGSVRLTSSQPKAPFGGRVDLAVEAPGAERVEIHHNARVVAAAEPGGEVSIDAAVLGRGPVRLQAFALPEEAASPPLWISVE